VARKRNLDTKLNQRRQVIFRRVVLDDRPLRLSELRELLSAPEYDVDKAKGDAEMFQAVGCKVELHSCPDDPNDMQFVFLDGPHTDDDTIREGLNREGKQLTARLAASLICGLSKCDDEWLLPSWMRDHDARKALDKLLEDEQVPEDEMAGKVRSVLTHLEAKLEGQCGSCALDTTENVLRLLKKSEAALSEAQKALRTRLYSFWEELYRLVAIDAGTTNFLVAEYLKMLRLPIANSSLCSLAVCTNSRRIFALLGPAHVSVKSIVIGGQQKFHSPAIAGAMAEFFLHTASILQFGMCILGATKIDMDRFVVCSDSQEEASIKNLFMERSSLRVICVDNSKLQTGPGREGYKFAAIDPKHVDLIITNSPFLTKNPDQNNATFNSFRMKIRAIEGRGVPVLVATSSETLPHPNDGEEPGPAKRLARGKGDPPLPTPKRVPKAIRSA
jgi:DeoR/GlpR family transcriptional regulator of sugar metabolism